jgi:hypothetical protein
LLDGVKTAALGMVADLTVMSRVDETIVRPVLVRATAVSA